MSGKRAIPMLLAVAILLLNAGDCISPLFADQQSKDCCAKGQCHRPQKKDPCCQTTPPSLIKYFQATGKVTFDHALPVATGRVVNTIALALPSLDDFSAKRLDTAEWPPGVAKSVSRPLLV